MASPVKIVVGAPNWVQSAMNAIDKKKSIKLVVNGPQAYTAWQALLRFRSGKGGAVTAVDPVVTPTVVITATIVVGVIAVVGLGVLATVLMYAISKGYCPIAKHKTSGPMPFDDELTIDVRRC